MKRFLVIALIVMVLIFSSCRNIDGAIRSFSQKDSSHSLSNVSSSSSYSSEILQDYKQVLLSQSTFFSMDDQKNTYLNEFSYWDGTITENPLIPVDFTILDMDGDNIPEVVLELTNGADGSVEVFHYYDGTVYGYAFVYRGLKNLKADGTFNFSSGASLSGYATLIFNGNQSTYNILGQSKYEDDGKTLEYLIDNQKVTEDQFLNFSAIQNQKQDATWMDFIPEHVDSIGH